MKTIRMEVKGSCRDITKQFLPLIIDTLTVVVKVLQLSCEGHIREL